MQCAFRNPKIISQYKRRYKVRDRRQTNMPKA